jgi:MtN3 and saliva related transmembrane protein
MRARFRALLQDWQAKWRNGANRAALTECRTFLQVQVAPSRIRTTMAAWAGAEARVRPQWHRHVMDYVAWTGYLAGILTTLAYLPQLTKACATRSTADISLRMMLVLSAGLSLWIVFGVLRGEIPIVIANSASLALALTIVVLKLRYG